MSKSDLVRMRHILDAAREAVSFVKGKTRADLDSNRQLSLSLLQLLQIVGEAGRAVSEETRNAYPDVAWAQMASMRNRLIHACYDVNLDAVWETATKDLPPLIARLERILPVP